MRYLQQQNLFVDGLLDTNSLMQYHIFTYHKNQKAHKYPKRVFRKYLEIACLDDTRLVAQTHD